MSDGPGWTPPVDPAAGGQPAWTPPPATPPPPPGAAWGTTPAAPPRWGEQNAPWGAPPVSKPGVIPLRPLALGEALDGAFTVIRHYPKVTLGLSAIVVVVTQLATFLLRWNELGADLADETGGAFDFNGRQFAAWIIGDMGNVFLAGLLVPVVAAAVLGRPATFRTSWERARPVLPALLVITLLAAVPWFGLLALAIPGIFVWGVWALAAPAVVMERLGPGAGLRRSWRLALPDFWRVWGTRALAVLIAEVLATIIAIPAVLLASWLWVRGDLDRDVDVAIVAIMMFAAILANTITMPFVAGVIALLYIDRRMRAEGLDVTLAQSAAAQGFTPAPGYGGGYDGDYGGGYGGGQGPGWPPAGPR